MLRQYRSPPCHDVPASARCRQAGDTIGAGFLKAGVLSEGALVRTKAGTPQGGVLSPLLANIMLSGIERRYARYVVHPNVTSLPPFDPLAELDDPG
jgi:retron-type reverse transcriptase